MTPRQYATGRAWECSLVLAQRAGLTPEQTIVVEIGLMAGPEHADWGLIALAAQILGGRQ